MVLAIPVIVCLVGVVLFFVGNGKPSQIGLEMFLAGLIVTLFGLVGHTLTIR